MSCVCTEGKIQDDHGETIGESGLKKHDCQYVIDRNELIDIAVAYANHRAKPHKQGDPQWERVFYKRMNFLWERKKKGESDGQQKDQKEKDKKAEAVA